MFKTGDKRCRECFAHLVPRQSDPTDLSCPNGHDKVEPVVVGSRRNVKAMTVADWPGNHQFGGCSVDVGSDRLHFNCPGCGMPGSIRVGHPKPSASPSWDIVSGSRLDPTTLTTAPSIHCISCCGWHGYLRSGVFESC